MGPDKFSERDIFMKTKVIKKYTDGKIRMVRIFFGNETFEVGFVRRKNHWMMWRKEKYPLPFTTGMWPLDISFLSLKDAKKYIRNRGYLSAKLLSPDPEESKHIW